MSRKLDRFTVEERADGGASMALFSFGDVGRVVRAAMDVTHAHGPDTAPQPYCCAAAFALLLTAAEALRRSPALARALDADQDADVRRQAAEFGAAAVARQAGMGH